MAYPALLARGLSTEWINACEHRCRTSVVERRNGPVRQYALVVERGVSSGRCGVSDLDVERLGLTRREILGAVEGAVRAQGEVVLEPRVHLIPPNGGKGHFNVLRGYVGTENVCGVKVVVDDWGQAGAGRFGALRRHVDEGLLTSETLHAELGDIVAGRAQGREGPDERVLFWHRGLATTDIAVAYMILRRAREAGLGTPLVTGYGGES